MAHTDGVGTSDVLLNYTGQLFTIGNQVGNTPLLSMTGGLTGGRAVATNTYPMGNFLTLDAAASNTVTETASASAPASDVYNPAQVINYIEIHHRAFELSYSKLSNSGTIAGEPVVNMGVAETTIATQEEAHLAQLAIDLEYSMWLGAGTDPTGAGVNGKTRGVSKALAGGSQEIDASSGQLTDTLVRSMEAAILAGNGMPQRPVMFGGAYQLQKLVELYGGPTPASTTIGGFGPLRVINLPLIGACGVAYTSVLTASVLSCIDVSKVRPVFQVVPGKPAVFIEPLSKTGAGEKKQIYCQFGCDYTHANWHAQIKALATSA